MQAFRQRKSLQNHRLPSFFLMNTTALHQALWLGWIAPNSSISCRWFQTSTTNGRAIHLNHSLKGVSSVTFIMCSIEWVQPNSTGSNENTLCYSARSQQAAYAISGGQESNPLRSNSLNSLPCLPKSIWGYGDPGACHPPVTGHPWVVQALVVPQLPWPLGFSSGGSVSKLCCSLSPQLPFLLPHLNSVYMFCTVRPYGKESSSVHKACTMTLICLPV